jgi:hypothetical protein
MNYSILKPHFDLDCIGSLMINYILIFHGFILRNKKSYRIIYFIYDKSHFIDAFVIKFAIVIF